MDLWLMTASHNPRKRYPAPTAPGTTAATVSRVRALYDFTPSEPGELAFKKNDIIAVLESVYKDWWKGSLRGQTGIFPLNYVEKLQDATKEELVRGCLAEQRECLRCSALRAEVDEEASVRRMRLQSCTNEL